MDKYFLIKKGYIYEYYHYPVNGPVEQVTLLYTDLPTIDHVTGAEPELNRVLLQASYSRTFVPHRIGLPAATEISKEQYEEALSKVNPVKPDLPMLPGLQSIIDARMHQLKKYPTSNDIGREVELLRAAICYGILAIQELSTSIPSELLRIDENYLHNNFPKDWTLRGNDIHYYISNAGAFLAAVLDILKEKEDIRKAVDNAAAKQTKACCTIFPEAIKTNCHE